MFVFLFVSMGSSASAYNQGLLYRQLFQNESFPNNNRYLEHLTDNNSSTICQVTNSPIFFTFPDEVNITSFYIKFFVSPTNTLSGSYLQFLDSSGSDLATIPLTSMANGAYNSLSLSGVKTIRFVNGDKDIDYIYDFEVYGVPSPPSGVTITNYVISHDRVTLQFTGNYVHEYEIYRDGVLINKVPGFTTSYVVTGLTPQTTYDFYVIGRSTYGASASAIVTLRTADPPPPSNVVVSHYSVLHDRVTLNFSATGADRFEIYQNGVFVDSVAATVNMYVVTGLSPTTTYQFHVVAVNAFGRTASSILPVKTLAPPPPPRSVVFQVLGVTDKTIRVSFSALDVSNFEVYLNGSLVTTLPGNSVGYTYAVQPATDYQVWIVAVNAYGRTASQIESVRTNDPLVPPFDLVLSVSKVYLEQVDLSFSVKKADTIHLYRDGRFLITLRGDRISYTDKNLSPDTEYTYKFVAVNQLGSVTSAEVKARTLKPPVTAVPTVQISPASKTFLSSMNFTLKSNDPAAELFYSFDGQTWVKYSGPVSISSTKTVFAKAVNSLGNESAVVVEHFVYSANPKVHLGIDLQDVSDAEMSHFNGLWPIIAFCAGVVGAFVLSKRIRNLSSGD
jgi:hypothetical protein